MDTRRSVAAAAFIFGEHHSFIKAVVLSKTRCHDDATVPLPIVYTIIVDFLGGFVTVFEAGVSQGARRATGEAPASPYTSAGVR